MPNNKNTTFEILSKYLKNEKVKINFNELKLQLLSHPSFPSLHSITGVLDHFNIENLALEVPQNIETLNQLPEKFISFVETGEKREIVFISKLSDSIEIIFGDKKKKQVSKEHFVGIWNGIIVVIDKDNFETSGSIQEGNMFSYNIYGLTLFLLIGTFFFFKPSIYQTSHYALSLLGIGISLILVQHELGFQSKTVDKFCSGSNEISDCDAVLYSKGATIFKNFKLSDVSLIYFIGLAFSWIISMQYNGGNYLIAMMSLIALPITFYSIYYQHKIVGKWCPLCLSIVGVLWLQVFTISLIKNPYLSIEINFTNGIIILLSFLLAISFWVFVKPILKKQNELDKLKVDYFKFKKNFTLFDAIYNRSPLYETNIDSSKEIILGNQEAPLKILLVTSPSCYYCKSAHSDMERILRKNHDKVKLTIRFNVRPGKGNISNLVASKLLEIYNKESENTIKLAMYEVYESDADLNKWLQKWGEPDDLSYSEILKMQKQWCNDNNINFTPAIFIDGKQYPKEYERSDLEYFIEDIIENCKTKEKLQLETETHN